VLDRVPWHGGLVCQSFLLTDHAYLDLDARLNEAEQRGEDLGNFNILDPEGHERFWALPVLEAF
jgi:hypothetical protein